MTTVTATSIPAAGLKRPLVPPLENGDRLTREEFERRYAEMPEGIKAELIEGVVYMAAVLSADYHGEPHADVIGWLIQYRAATPGVGVADNSSVRLDLGNEPQPDACIYVQPKFGGRVQKSPDGYIEGAPELVVEVAGSSVSIDLNQKLEAYRRNNVLEYIVLRTYDGEVDWFALKNGRFEKVALPSDGLYRSAVFPGLWLSPASLTSGNITEVLATLTQGIASPEHAEFVKRLAIAHRP